MPHAYREHVASSVDLEARLMLEIACHDLEWSVLERVKREERADLVLKMAMEAFEGLEDVRFWGSEEEKFGDDNAMGEEQAEGGQGEENECGGFLLV